MSTGVERAPRPRARRDRHRSRRTGTCPRPRSTKKRSAATKGVIAAEGPLVCRTGPAHRPSPNDKFIVREPSSEAEIAWGRSTGRWSRRSSTRCTATCWRSLEGKELFVQDCYAGADPAYRLPVRVITEYAWHSLFCRNLFIDDPAAAQAASPQFTVIDAPSFKADPARHGTQLRGRHRAELRQAAGAHRRHELRRRDEEVDLQRAELPAAAAGRAADALLGQRRRRRRRRRCSSACRAPARRRCRAIPSGG